MRAWGCTFLLLYTLAISPSAQAQLQSKAPAKLAITDAFTGLAFIAVPAACGTQGRDAEWPPFHQKADFLWSQLSPGLDVAADEHPAHEVCLDAYEMAQTELSVKAWQRLSGPAASGKESGPVAAPSGSTGRGSEPMRGLSWEDVQAWLVRLNASAPQAHPWEYRLPTEAQWEHACRAGRQRLPDPEPGQRVEGVHYRHGWGSGADEVWGPVTVEQAGGNPWGFVGLLGNVWEWTADAWRADAYSRRVLYNPTEAEGGLPLRRVLRGGSFRTSFLDIRCEARSAMGAQRRMDSVGVRLVRVRKASAP